MGSRMYDKETGRLAQYGLNQQVQMTNWPTVTQDSATMRDKPYAQGGTPLTFEAANWMTPNTMDALAPKSQEALDYEHDTARQGRSNPNNLRDQAAVQEGVTNWPTVTTQEIPHEDMELTDTGRRKARDGEDSHSLNLQDTAANWPTPNTRDTRRGCNQKQLATEVDKWQTPQARDYKGPNTGFQEMLPNQVQKWPTPNASEHKYRMQGNSQQSNGLTATARKSLYLSTHQDLETGTDGTGSSDSTQASHQPSAKKDTCTPKCRRLNPAMAEHLMGLPLGWTQTSGYDSSATESYQQFRHSLSELLREN